MPPAVNLNRISVVLRSPRYPENIGSAARAMCNMGFSRLIVVTPENYDLVRIHRMATHAASEVVEQIEVYDDLNTALNPFQYVVGLTARIGKHRSEISTPAIVADDLIAVSQKNETALLFGPEDRGLTNDDTKLCHRLVNIPTAAFASLNLSQAVVVMCYELFQKTASAKHIYTPRLANRFELDGMYAHLREMLLQIGFLNPDNPDYWMNNFRSFFNRIPLRAKEVKLIRGICRQMNWYAEKRYQDGLRDALKNHPDEGRKITDNDS